MIYFRTGLLLLGLTLPLSANAQPTILHISVDGLYGKVLSVFGRDELPGFYRLMDEGVSTTSARTDADFTNTLPNHSSQLTGRRVLASRGGHGWTRNRWIFLTDTLHNPTQHYVPSVFDVVHDHGLSTVMFASKYKFSLFNQSYNAANGAADSIGLDNGTDKIDRYVFNEDTDELVDELVTDLKETKRHYVFLHLRNPDTAGHEFGWRTMRSSEYIAAVKEVDKTLLVILEFLDTHKRYKGLTTVILTSDHGGKLDSYWHPHTDVNSHIIPFLVWGNGVEKGSLYEFNSCTSVRPDRNSVPDFSADKQPIRNGDVANLSLRLLGLPKLIGSQMDTIKYINSSGEKCFNASDD